MSGKLVVRFAGLFLCKRPAPRLYVYFVLSPVRNARISAGFDVEPLAGTRYALYSSF